MTPLEKIKQGILTKNWNLVVDGYNAYSDKKIKLEDEDEEDFLVVPKRRSGVKQRREREPIYTGENEYTLPQNADELDDDEKDCRAEPFVKKRRVNMFLDDGDNNLIDYTQKDVKFDKENKTKQKTPRPRPYKPLRVTCYNCGRLYDVNPVLAPGGSYRCDSCNKGR